MWWTALAPVAGKVLDWFGDNEWAGDLLGGAAKELTYDAPEMDYDKFMEMAIAENVMRNPDSSNAFGYSRSTVDPKTGKTTMESGFNPRVQNQLDTLFDKLEAPSSTYRSALGGSGLMDKFMNDRQDFMGVARTQGGAPQMPQDFSRPTPVPPEESDAPALPAAQPAAQQGRPAGAMDPAVYEDLVRAMTQRQ